MRLLTIGNMYPPHHLGGYELVWQDGVGYVRSRGWDVRILTTGFRRNDAANESEDEDVHRELDWYWRDHGWPRMSIRQRIALERRNGAILERHLDEFRPDVVGWWAMGGMSLSLIERVRRRGVAAAGFVCDEWMIYGPNVDGWLRLTRRASLRLVAERLTGIPTRLNFSGVGPWLFPSEMLRREAAAEHRLARTAVAHQGVDRQVFAEAEQRPWDWRLLYVGRIDSRKGIELAIESLVTLPDKATLEIVGSGDDRHLADLRALADRLGVRRRVTFRPAESRTHLRERYAQANAVLFPVLWREPWGLVPLEAMAVGRPVIASGRGGSGEYLRDGENCLLFDPNQGSEALAHAVRALSADPELRERLVEGGRATTARISSAGFNEAMEATLDQALAQAHPSGAGLEPAH